MEIVRLYGQGPYKAVLVHGGPGAISSLKGFAKELNDRTNIGVVEAIQSKHSINELIEELHRFIKVKSLSPKHYGIMKMKKKCT